MIKDHGDMGGRIALPVVLDIAEQHVAKARNRPDGQAIRFARQGGQRVIGAKDEG